MSKLNFNDHLDDMMERLMNEDITNEELELEIKRSKAICQIADRKIQNNKTTLLALKMVSDGDIKKEFITNDLIPEAKQIKQ